jgi:hypothetical protein
MPILSSLAVACARAYGFTSLTAGGFVTVIQSFTATGDWVCPTGVTEVEWLVVAGGGGGGGSAPGGGGGGGAGGFRTGTGLSVTAGTTYTVTVGAGGPGSLDAAVQGSDGNPSEFNTITSTGGGGGGATSAQAQKMVDQGVRAVAHQQLLV